MCKRGEERIEVGGRGGGGGDDFIEVDDDVIKIYFDGYFFIISYEVCLILVSFGYVLY